MSASIPVSDQDAIANLQVEIDGQTLYAGQRRTRCDRITCMLVCGGTRLGGSALLVIAAWLALRDDWIGAFNTFIFGATLLIGGIIGLRQFQNAPQRLVLNAEGLTYIDTWTGTRRHFERPECVETRCGSSNEGCAIYVLHPNHGIDLLIDDLPHDVATNIVQTLNAHLGRKVALA